MLVRWSCLVGLAAVSSVAQAQLFVPVSLLPFANDRLQNRNAGFPAGNPVLGGVPFRMEPSGNNVWFAELAGGTNPRVLEIPINITGVSEVHTLVSSAWGQAGPGVLAQVQFVGANGTIVTEDLVGNVNVRDWNQGSFTNTISAPNTQMVVSLNGGNQRMDKQVWTLPTAFRTEELRRIRFIDSGAANVQRIYVQGVTLMVAENDPRVWNVGPGANGHSYQAVQTPEGITWAAAQAQATLRGGYLATITSAEENAFIYSFIGGNQGFWRNGAFNANDAWGPWIGGVQAPGAMEPAGGWGWVTGEAFGYTNWSAGEPNNLFQGNVNEDRVHFFGFNVPANNRWNDLPGNQLLRGYVIEWDGAVCDSIDFNNDGGLFDPTDIDAFLSVFSEGPCIPETALCNDIDFNNDGGLFDPCDIEAFLLVFAEGPCTICGQ